MNALRRINILSGFVNNLIKPRLTSSVASYFHSQPPIAPLLPPPRPINPIIEKPKSNEARQELPTRMALIDELIAPSLYEFKVNIKPEIKDPRPAREQIKCVSRGDKYGSIPPFNYSNSIMHIKHRKMKKHQRRKWMKANLAQVKYTRLRRNIAKEKAFRAEIFGKVREAEKFDAEKYVDDILSTIDKAPKEETKEAKLLKVFDLIRQHRSETHQITPKFDDPVVSVHKASFKIK